MTGCQSKTDLKRKIEQVASELPKAEADARAVGIVLTAKELAPEPLPDANNGWLLIEKAWQQSGFSQKEVGEMAKLGYDDASLEKLQTLLSSAGAGIALVYEACEKPGFYIKRNWDVASPTSILFPEFAHAKSIAKVFAAKAILEAKNGDVDLMVRDLQVVFQMAEATSRDEKLLTHLVKCAIRAIGYRAMESCLAANPAVSQGLIRDWSIDFTKDQLVSVIRDEYAIMGVETRQTFAPESWKTIVSLGVAGDSEFAEFALHSKQLADSGAKPESISRAARTRVLQSGTELVRELHLANDLMSLKPILANHSTKLREDNDKTKLFSRVLSSGTTQKLPFITLRPKMKEQLIQGLSKVVAFKQKSGSFPKSLEEAGFTDLDALTNKPFGYIVKGNEARVYSVGEDLVDNQGVEKSESNGGEFDEVAIYPRSRAPKKP